MPTVPHRASDYLKTPEAIAAYLNVVLDDPESDHEDLMVALRNVAGGVSELSRRTGPNRAAGLSRALSARDTPKIDESNPAEGQLRKLNTLRKSVGNEIAEEAFAKRLSSQWTVTTDKNAELIANTLWPLIEQRNLMIPRGGYLVRRGRGRIVIERATNPQTSAAVR